jgi:rubredoxin
MNEQWQELKETIIELRDSDGTGTQQEVCNFLVNYMGILEKQMQESVVSKQVVIDIVDSYSESQSNVEDVTQDIISDIVALQPVNSQTKTGHWIAQDIHNCHTDFKCSECGYIHSFMHIYGEPTADYTYCPYCGARMQEVESEDNR